VIENTDTSCPAADSGTDNPSTISDSAPATTKSSVPTAKVTRNRHTNHAVTPRAADDASL